jgi:hypothetical protein
MEPARGRKLHQENLPPRRRHQIRYWDCTTKATGEKKLMVILADFPDVKRQYPEQTISDRMLGFVANYFREASYNKMSFKGEMTKHYLLPNLVSYYKISARSLGS